MGNILIWDTCTNPSYYSDLHKVLALPESSIIKYDYKRKYFDDESVVLLEKLNEKKIKDINVILFYGEIDGYEKDITEIPKKALVENIVPVRMGRIINVVIQTGGEHPENDIFIYNIELLKYPNAREFETVQEQIIKQITNRRPFIKWHSYYDNLQINSPFKVLYKNINEYSNKNWEFIYDNLRKLQFKNDSFWRIDGPFNIYRKRMTNRMMIRESTDGLVKCFIDIKDEEDLYFSIYNRESISNEGGRTIDRTINVKTTGNIDSEVSSIDLRPYSIEFFFIRARTDSFWKGDVGSLELETLPKDDNYPVGPKINLTFNVKKKRYKIILGSLLGIIGVTGFFIFNKFSPYTVIQNVKILNWTTIWIQVGGYFLSSVCTIFSAVFLRKEIKPK